MHILPADSPVLCLLVYLVTESIISILVHGLTMFCMTLSLFCKATKDVNVSHSYLCPSRVCT